MVRSVWRFMVRRSPLRMTVALLAAHGAFPLVFLGYVVGDPPDAILDGRGVGALELREGDLPAAPPAVHLPRVALVLALEVPAKARHCCHWLVVGDQMDAFNFSELIANSPPG